METVLAWLHARLHDLALPKQQKILAADSNRPRLLESVTLNKGETPAAAVTRALAIRAKRAAAIAQADCHDLVGIANAFPTDADVQNNVCWAMADIAYYGGVEGARKLLAAGGHCAAATADVSRFLAWLANC